MAVLELCKVDFVSVNDVYASLDSETDTSLVSWIVLVSVIGAVGS